MAAVPQLSCPRSSAAVAVKFVSPPSTRTWSIVARTFSIESLLLRVGCNRRGDDRALDREAVNLRSELARGHLGEVGECVLVRVRQGGIGSVDQALRTIEEAIVIRVGVERIGGARPLAREELEAVREPVVVR